MKLIKNPKKKSRFFNINTNENSVNPILRRSAKATCGVMEREVVVDKEKVQETKIKLRKAGFTIIGTSEPVGKTRKIWFIPMGGF